MKVLLSEGAHIKSKYEQIDIMNYNVQQVFSVILAVMTPHASFLNLIIF